MLDSTIKMGTVLRIIDKKFNDNITIIQDRIDALFRLYGVNNNIREQLIELKELYTRRYVSFCHAIGENSKLVMKRERARETHKEELKGIDRRLKSVGEKKELYNEVERMIEDCLI